MGGRGKEGEGAGVGVGGGGSIMRVSLPQPSLLTTIAKDPAASMATPVGLWNDADVPAPSEGPKMALLSIPARLPATVVTRPLARVTRRRRWL